MELQSESWKRQQVVIPPNRVKYITNHSHRIPTQIWSKSQSAKSTQSITKAPPLSFFPLLQSTKCDEIRVQPFIHTIQINHPNTATHTSAFHLNNSKLNQFSNQPLVTQTQRVALPSPSLSLLSHLNSLSSTHSNHTPQSHPLPLSISILSPFTPAN